MNKPAKFSTFVAFILVTLVWASGMRAQVAPPRIFFSDLESGPNSGGQNNKGAFVTIYGKGFGSGQGTSNVTVGGGTADNCPVWSDTKVTCQLGSRAQSGNIIITVGGASSNGVPFTVRSGNILFVSPSGSDSNSGSFSAPFRSLTVAKHALNPGDILYAMDGVTQTSEEDFNAAMLLDSSGNQGSPKAVVAYPGATVTIGVDSPAGARPQRAIHAYNHGTPVLYWTIAGLKLRATDTAFEMPGSQNLRIVGNEMTCPNAGGPSACIHSEGAGSLKVLGNYVHDTAITATGGNAKLYHSIYFSTDTNHVEVAWNTVVPNGGGCRGIQFHSTPQGGGGFNQFDLSVHDNLIHDVRCDGLNFATVDPSKGKVEAYNNVIYRAGFGPDPGDLSNYTCIYIPGGTNAGPSPGLSAAVEIFNNTLFDCGSRGGPDSGGIATFAQIKVNLRDNIFYLQSGETYFSANSTTSLVSGSNNLFFGGGAGPSFLSGNVNSDPKFVSTGSFNLHLQSGSPAIDAGTSTGVATDFDGVARPQGSAFDIGAFEFAKGGGGGGPTQPNPPANLRVVTAK